MRITALALDLDGTLLTPHEEVSPRNLAAVQAAIAAGLRVIVASARWRQLAARVAAEIGTDAPVVACSGAQVWRPSDGRDIYDVRLPSAFASALYEICDSNRCVATLVDENDVFLSLEGAPDMSQVPAEMRWVPKLLGAASLRPRIALIQGGETNRIIRERLEGEWGGRVRFVESISSRGKSILTLTAAGADKGLALRAACAEIGIDPGEVAAFGDADNDIEMFRIAGAAVVMGQANDNVKAHATFVTVSNEEDGVAVAIERLLARGSL